MTIRAAEPADLRAIMALVCTMAQESRYLPSRPNVAHMERQMCAWLSSDAADVWIGVVRDETVVGLLVLLRYTDLVSGEPRAAQACWYVDPRYRSGLGGRLLDRAEARARTRGSVSVEMVAPDHRFEAFFASRGYHATSRTYERSL